MISKYFINKYKSLRKQSYLNKIVSYQYKYAFIGAGSHSIANLYPCIKYLNVPLKYICTRNKKNAVAMAAGFIGCSGTDDMNSILNDEEIKGVFICTQASSHYELTKKCLQANKNVFVEKPICFSLEELKDLIKIQANNICMTGLQRRFSVINRSLVDQKLQTQHYHYRYLTGAYPDGDLAYELFIHPIDNVVQLFGNAVVSQITKIKAGDNATYFIHLLHNHKIMGALELSTNYTWSSAAEFLEINTEKEIFQCHYPNRLTGIKKTQTLLNIPVEKIFHKPITQNIYFDNSGFSPILNNNNLFVQGFYGEIEHFVASTEENKKDEFTHLNSLLNTYAVLDQIKSAK